MDTIDNDNDYDEKPNKYNRLVILINLMPAVAERLRRAYPAPLGRAGVGSIPANPDERSVPSFRRWRFEMKLSPFFLYLPLKVIIMQHGLNSSGV